MPGWISVWTRAGSDITRGRILGGEWRRMAELGHVTLRMVKVPLPDNKEEILITNLPSETFDHLKIAELYLMRWNKEGYFSQSSSFFYDNSSVICRNYRKCMGIMQNRV